MAHPQQIQFCNEVRKALPHLFADRIVIDIGSLDINGNNQHLFERCMYIGIDVAPGRNVDFCCAGHELALPEACADTIISTECFEHDMFYDRSIKNAIRMLKPGGLFLFTCATTGRPEHGTRRSAPGSAPLLNDRDEWADYYKNLEEKDIRQCINIESTFSSFAFSNNMTSCDLYFWGIKHGDADLRDNYSFKLTEPVAASDDKDRIIRHLLDLLDRR